MEVYAVMEFVPGRAFGGEELSTEQLDRIFNSPRKALKYINDNSRRNGNKSHYNINVYDAETGELLDIAEYRMIEGKMRRLKGSAVAY